MEEEKDITVFIVEDEKTARKIVKENLVGRQITYIARIKKENRKVAADFLNTLD